MARRRAREERGHRASRVNRELITRTIERDRVEPLSRIVFGELTAPKAVPVAVLEVHAERVPGNITGARPRAIGAMVVDERRHSGWGSTNKSC